MSHREDWRSLPLITIDPADAKDHDDAVYAEPDPSPDNPGGVIVTVAIADVSWYVRARSALDLEALKRGNSVYFPDRVVPMLPERISNDLCSLKEDVDRPALAVRMRFSKEGRKAGHTFHRIMASPSAFAAGAKAPLQVVVSREQQSLVVYDGDTVVATSRVSTGKAGHATPTGIFSILEKRRRHESNIYSNAPMPFMPSGSAAFEMGSPIIRGASPL